MPVNTTDLQAGGTANTPVGQQALTAFSSVTVANQLSACTLSVNTFCFSIQTAASATAIADGSLGLVFRASGISLVYKSGSTIYSFGTNGVGASFTSGTA